MKTQQFHVKNQFLITDTEGNVFFQSYDTIIAKRDNHGFLFLDAEKWDYSTTTSKYRNLFTGLNTADTKKAIKEGKITLINLN